MWHDISIRYKDHALHVFDVIEEGNYNLNKEIQNTLYITHNLSPIIYWAISYLWLDIDSFWAWLDWRQCSDAITTLDKMYKHIKKNKKKYQPMQPENWRGSYDWLVKKLKALLDACKEYPECVIYDCY
jgi:hypothetical protein